MTLADLKEQIVDTFKSRWAQFQESSIYIRFKERFDDLSPSLQKVVIISSGVFLVLFLLMMPWGWMQSSNDFIESYESKRNLIRNLFQLKRDLAQAPQIPSSVPVANLKGQVQTAMQNVGLTQDQIKAVEEVTLSSDSTSDLVPRSVTQAGIQLTISKINIEQFIDLSYRLQKINPSAKLLSVDMKSNDDDNHYYDVIYQLVGFSVPEAEVPQGGEEVK